MKDKARIEDAYKGLKSIEKIMGSKFTSKYIEGFQDALEWVLEKGGSDGTISNKSDNMGGA